MKTIDLKNNSYELWRTEPTRSGDVHVTHALPVEGKTFKALVRQINQLAWYGLPSDAAKIDLWEVTEDKDHVCIGMVCDWGSRKVTADSVTKMLAKSGVSRTLRHIRSV